MSKLKVFVAVCALSASISQPLAAQDADTVVATVDGTDITLGHMIAMRERLPAQYQQLDDQTLFDGILEQLVQQSALADGADSLSRRGELVLENERRALAASEVIESLAADAVTDEAIQAAYEEAYGSAEPATEYNASHILVETEEEAQALIQEIEGGADFAEVAREHSTGPSGPSGGELGWFTAGQMVPAFDEAVQEMSAGELAGPVQTEFGWHVIKLNDTREKDAPSLDEVRDELAAVVQEQAVADMVTEATNAATIERSADGIDPSVLRDESLLTD